jgi:AraC-like DNA-binding protein
VCDIEHRGPAGDLAEDQDVAGHGAFKQTIGETPYRWLLRQRAKVAKKMLAGSEKSIAEITIAGGFADQSHLTRVFSGIIGVPPVHGVGGMTHCCMPESDLYRVSE